MINVDKNIVVLDKCCSHHWIWEVIIGSSRTVYIDFFIDVKVINNLKSVEDDKVKNSIVEIGAAIKDSLIILNDFFSFDVDTLDVVLESGLVSLSIVLDND